MSAEPRPGLPSRRSRWDAVALAAVVLLVGLPAILTRDGFMYDFTNHLWLVWVQGQAIAADGSPTYFLHTGPDTGGVFDPFFVFYGGTLYAVTGALSALLGDSPRIAYVASILVSVAAAYGGLLWLARQLGARTWMAHAPALTFVASAYYVTNLYGRGAWPEFVATSAIGLLVASGTRIARAPRVEALPCALFVAAATIAAGSHNITLAWGAVAICATLVALRVGLRAPLVAGRRQLGLLLVLLGLAVCVNAWFLLPNVLHAGDTQIANSDLISWAHSAEFNSPRAVLHPLRYVPSSSGAPALYVQAPVWMLAWALGALVLLRRRMGRALRRAALAVGAVLLGFLALVLVEPLWALLPEVLRLIQVPYRLNTYVALLGAGLVLVAVLAAERAGDGRAGDGGADDGGADDGGAGAGRVPRGLAAGLVVAVAVTVGLCAWQLFVPETHAERSYDDLSEALVSPNVPPRTWYSNEAYLDSAAPVVSYRSRRVVAIDPTGVRGDRATLTLRPPRGRAPFAMTMGGGREIVEVEGLERVGRTASGFTVARRTSGGGGLVRVTFAIAGGATTAGTVVSLLALAALAGLALLALLHARRRRRRKRARLRALRRPAGGWRDVAAPLVAMVLVGLPAMLSHDGFTYDYTNHLWLVWVQDHAISATGAPSYFVHTTQADSGVFDPFFMFYGGTLYAVAGGLSVLLGHSPRIAFVLSILACAAAAYGSLLWLARQLGVRSWMGHAPAVAYVAGSGYFVANIYGRGAWPEFVAMSAIPLLLASGLHIARSPRLRTLPCLLFVAAALFATGSHNITLIWGALVLVATLAILRLLLRRRLVVGRRQLTWLVVMFALGAGLNAWYLLPDVVLAGDTQIAHGELFDWDVTAGFNTPGTLFWPLRHAPPESAAGALYVQVPVWLLAWALAALALLRRRVPARLRRAALALAIPLAALLALIFVEPLYEALPRILRLIQFPYRLVTFVDLLICGLILVAALAIERRASGRERRLLSAGLAVATAASVALCAWQLFVPETHQNQYVYEDFRDAFVSPNVAPITWYNNNSYLDVAAPVVRPGRDRIAPGPVRFQRRLTIDPQGLHGNSATLTLDPPAGRAPFAMTIGASPRIVRMRGLERLGRTKDGLIVARRPDGGSDPIRVSFELDGATVDAGRVVTLLSLLALVALAGLRALRLRSAGRRA